MFAIKHLIKLGLLIVFACCFASFSMESGTRQTTNGFGMNFESLGACEEEIVCEIKQRAANSPNARILFLAAAYGRFPLRLVNELENPVEIFVNELEPNNIEGFKQHIAELKRESHDQQIGQNAHKVTIITGDCLALQTDPTLLIKVGNPNDAFDSIVVDNLVHFFDGKQILKLLINSFNMLKPGGKLYLFFQGRPRPFTRDEILNNTSFGCIYLNIIHNISACAQNDPNILFPGLVKDEWMLGKSKTIDYLLGQKPNGIGQCNFIQFESIQKIASAVGYKVGNPSFYDLINAGSFRKVENEVHSVALVLSKPESVVAEVTIKHLDMDLVAQCNNALEIMKDFFESEGNLSFHEPYPFISKGKNFCHYEGCFKKHQYYCGKCQKTGYCSRECQINHWKTHKADCKPVVVKK